LIFEIENINPALAIEQPIARFPTAATNIPILAGYIFVLYACLFPILLGATPKSDDYGSRIS